MIYSLRELVESQNNQANINGKWVPARPLMLSGFDGFTERVKAAWLVLQGKADAVIWPEGQ